ncbi:hypothetical protein OEZ85_012182 [Tetradesmus obliquus]|uniref:Uncharacterized protein n=1 Tax=Tetradesmus obliquus TaxID=3088 RepID=A0ABY8TXC0_TETOB|nr:hypothetical protein OEZ85_012182 [Tetradesmus obliquus]
MPPSSATLQPGPHDPYNASSVKLAEATRIRLVLPGLGTSEKDEGGSSTVKRSNTGDLSGKPAESAAALAKARKKLLKIQGIASQADKAHSSVIVDVGVLAGDAAASDEEQGAADGRSPASASSSAAAGRSSEAAAAQERRGSKQGTAAGSATAGSNSSQQLKPRKTAVYGDSGKFSSRLALPSPGTSAADAAGSIDSAGGSSGARSAAASSRSSRGQPPDKPYVPIWERLLPPSAPAEERKGAAATHRVFAPVALKTFSPTLGSLGSSLVQQEPGRTDEAAAMTARAAAGGSRSRSAAKSQGQPPDISAGASSPQWRQGDGSRIASKPMAAAAAADLGLRSQSFTNGYQSPSQLFEKLTLGGQ